jgi:hypothetical protein
MGGRVREVEILRTRSAAQKARNEGEYPEYWAERDIVHTKDPMAKESKAEI